MKYMICLLSIVLISGYARADEDLHQYILEREIEAEQLFGTPEKVQQLQQELNADLLFQGKAAEAVKPLPEYKPPSEIMRQAQQEFPEFFAGQLDVEFAKAQRTILPMPQPSQAAIISQRPVYYMPPAPTMTVQRVAVVQPPVDPGPVRSYYDEYYADQIKAEVEHAKQMALLEQRQQERQSAAPREAVVIVTEAADSSAAHIEMQTRNAKTTASIPNAMTATQQDTIAQLAAYQLKIDQQAAKLEQQRQEFLHLQTVLVLAVLGSIPLLGALYWTGKQAMHEWRAIQDLRHRQKLEESQTVQKEFQAAEHFIEKM